MNQKNQFIPVGPEHEGFLHDESRQSGTAGRIAFPETEADVIELLRNADETITIQGALTGITAAAVPRGGTILNLSRMNRIGDVCDRIATVEPGALLCDIQEAVGERGLFFPPDPTETSASIGGMAACNASGARSFFYGATRNWISAIRVVLADGSVLYLRRGEQVAAGRWFSLTTESGRIIEGTLPSYKMPAVKSAAGYFVRDDMDLIDLFIGAEGTLGVIIKLELKLLEKPALRVGLTAFLPSEEAALKFVRVFRESEVRPVAIEFFNHDALDLLRAARDCFEEIPELKPHVHTAVYLEFYGAESAGLEERAGQVFDTLLALGGGEDDCWFAESEKELEQLKAFRHAVPEAVNLQIDERRKKTSGLTKLGTDMSVPDSELEAVMTLYREGLEAAGLESVIFGHIGNNHVHVNILPRDLDEYEKGKQLYLSWADQVVAMGGSVSAEHGIGKIKVSFLRRMIGEVGLEEMRGLKARFDPKGVFNVGTLFSAKNAVE